VRWAGRPSPWEAHAGQQGADAQLPSARACGQHGLDPRRDTGSIDDAFLGRQRDHGPYHQWTCSKNGKTATRILSDEQLADYAPWFDNHRRPRELIAELEELSLAITEADPRWNR
jgi:hypothetical protein